MTYILWIVSTLIAVWLGVWTAGRVDKRDDYDEAA